jgi:hypothetical protein
VYNHVEIKAFKGLFLNQNSFSVPDGALEQAENCVIAKDNVIEKRRGFFTFLIPAAGTVLNNLYTYQNTLMGLYNSKLQWIDSIGAGTDLSGETISLSGGRIGRFVDSNDNLYFTSDNGIMKIEAYNSAVYKSGVAPGLDLRGKLAAANGPLLGGNQVNYRVVFGKTDGNNNLLLGAPSDILTIINRQLTAQAWSRTGSTVTVTTTVPHNLTSGMVVTTVDPDDTSVVGTFTITVTSPTTFTYTSGSGSATGTLAYSTSRNTNLEGTIPSEINSTDYFYQIYRSSQADATASAAPLDFKLIQQVQLTSADLTDDVFFYTDTIDDLFLGAELYTNPNSQEGELQANNKAPLAQDLALFKNYVFYGNTISRHLLSLALTSTSTTYINAGDYVEIKLDAVTRRYVARTGVGNSTVSSTSITGSGTLTITYTAHGFSNGDTIYVSNVAGGSFAAGVYTVGSVAADTFQITGSGTATSLDFQGISNGSYPIFTLLAPGSSVATGLDTTARALVKAVNRDSSSPVYARYLSTATDIPGKFYLQAKGFGGAIYVRASSAAAGSAFTPNLPDAFGSSVVSSNDVLPNNLFYSKLGEPEAVPLQNSLSIGSRNKAILRIFALRDSLIILKEDGVYRLDGDSPSNFTATPIDTTVICLVPNSAAVLNNQVCLLSNQGVAMVSNSSVQIVSHRIEDPVTPIFISPDLVSQTAGIAYESARLYLLTTLSPNSNTASVVWCYNTLNDSWTTWDQYFSAGAVGPNDTLYLISTQNTLKKQRRLYNRTDYADESFAVDVSTVSADKMTASFTSPLYVPQIGDMLVYNGLISIIRSVSVDTGTYTVTFNIPSNLDSSSTAYLYEAFPAVIKFAPFTGGQTNRMKQYAQMTIRPRDNSISTMEISFTNDSFGGSEVTNWSESNVTTNLGWGLFPWGFDAWGQGYGTNLNFQTTQAVPLRIYVPLFAQRGAFIQAVLKHSTAGEPLNIQAIGFQVRGYGERVST